MGGGQVGLPKQIVDVRTARELRDRCSENPGDYWMATDLSLGHPVVPGRVSRPPRVDGAPDVTTANEVPPRCVSSGTQGHPADQL